MKVKVLYILDYKGDVGRGFEPFRALQQKGYKVPLIDLDE